MVGVKDGEILAADIAVSIGSMVAVRKTNVVAKDERLANVVAKDERLANVAAKDTLVYVIGGDPLFTSRGGAAREREKLCVVV